MDGMMITGSAKRIGAALARGLAAYGWHVFIHHHQSSEDAEQLVMDIAQSGGKASPVRADLGDPDQVAGLLDACDGVAPLTCIINNASTFPFDVPAAMDPTLWDRVMQVNLRTPVILASQLHDRMRSSARRGCVINVLDNKLLAMNPDYFTYTLSKAGLQAATEAMAMAFGGRLRCAGIAPGITLPSHTQTDAEFANTHNSNPLHRGGRVEDLLAAARFILATDSYSGQVLTIDGGLHLARPHRDIAFLE